MSSTRHSLILGVAAKYPVDLILPFLKSLRTTSYAGKVCLFVGQMSAEAITQIESYADDVIVLDDVYGGEIKKLGLQGWVNFLAKVKQTRRVRRLYPALFRMTLLRAMPEQRKRLQQDLEQRLEGFQALRYQHYQEYIRKCAPNADYVMITDVRDVLFQGDPFAHLFENDLEVFLEADQVKIGSEPFARRWVKNLYGAATLQQLQNKTVSCSGATMGTRPGILRYLDQMVSRIMEQEQPLGSHDQGVHNYLLWKNRLDPVTIYANGTGPVLTLGLEKNINRDSDGRLLNQDGTKVPVVHQYDRHVGLADELLREYNRPVMDA